jgi:cation diffusion facilitator CzcD-associated flavoprotein CzcO
VSEFIETIVVGGGQAGLAISYHLKQEGREHLVLERLPLPMPGAISVGIHSHW